MIWGWGAEEIEKKFLMPLFWGKMLLIALLWGKEFMALLWGKDLMASLWKKNLRTTLGGGQIIEPPEEKKNLRTRFEEKKN